MIDLIGYYFTANILVIISYFLIEALMRKKWNLSFLKTLHIAYLLLGLTLSLPFLMNFLGGGGNPFEPIIKVWSPESFFVVGGVAKSSLTSVVSAGNSLSPVSLTSFELSGIAMVLALGFIFVLIRVVYSLRKLVFLEMNSIKIKHFGRVEIWMSESIVSPFSYRIASSRVFLPMSALQDMNIWKLSMRHELQHHRQRDTTWVYFLEIFRAVFVLNPFTHFLIKRVSELQEFACDEALLKRRDVNAGDYGKCLFEFANQISKQTAQQPSLVGATGMASEQLFLRRRIEAMFFRKKKTSKVFSVVATVSAAALLSASAWALNGTVSDKRLKLSDAQRLAERASQESEIPIVIDSEVLHWLNKAVGSIEGRRHFKNSLRRMKTYEEMIRMKLGTAKLPLELLAVPLVESGYQNIDKPTSMGSVGIWQFIPSTARRCGLIVNSERDERMNPERHTDAAVCYYTKLFAAFKNWHAALLSYGIGEHRVLSAITSAGHDDVLKLVRDGKFDQWSRSYLPKMIAAIIVLKNQRF